MIPIRARTGRIHPVRGPELDNNQFERIPAYQPSAGPGDDSSAVGAIPDGPFARFKALTFNTKFKFSVLTWFSFFILLVAYPLMSILGPTDPSELLRNMSQGMVIFTLLITVIMLWMFWLLIFGSTYLEGTGLRGIGLQRLRLVDFAWAIAYAIVANLVLTGLAWLLNQMGYPLSEDIGLLIPKGDFGLPIWILVSFTAGFCEEMMFRGYLMTRLRLLFKTKTWVLPVLLSAVSFGACHAYQGVPGLVLITVYGIGFALLYIHTGYRIWPCIIAHVLHDLSAAAFYPR